MSSARAETRRAFDCDAGWDPERWVRILDRIQHRQPEVGLRFWGPPLWLEVTMTGPDSDVWPAIGSQGTAWDWQSSDPCADVDRLVSDGVDDDGLLAVVSRYTIENLILNAVHEIGEWFRFDGRRLFPAHKAGAAPPFDRDQGNGSVTVHLEFGQPTHREDAAPARRRSRRHPDADRVVRLQEAAAPSRFTYLPATTISYEAAGPVIRRWSRAEPSGAWRSSWSSSTLQALAANAPDVLALIGRDVHRALVSYEADRICRAFHVDDRRPWRLRVPESALGAEPAATEAHGAELLSISIGYADTRARDAKARRKARLV